MESRFGLDMRFARNIRILANLDFRVHMKWTLSRAVVCNMKPSVGAIFLTTAPVAYIIAKFILQGRYLASVFG